MVGRRGDGRVRGDRGVAVDGVLRHVMQVLRVWLPLRIEPLLDLVRGLPVRLRLFSRPPPVRAPPQRSSSERCRVETL